MFFTPLFDIFIRCVPCHTFMKNFFTTLLLFFLFKTFIGVWSLRVRSGVYSLSILLEIFLTLIMKGPGWPIRENPPFLTRIYKKFWRGLLRLHVSLNFCDQV